MTFGSRHHFDWHVHHGVTLRAALGALLVTLLIIAALGALPGTAIG